MKKVKLYLVSLLTILMALFSFVGCGPVGKYTATAYKSGSISYAIEESNFYIELKQDKTAVINIEIPALLLTINDNNATWEKGEGKEVKITTRNITYTATVDGKTLSFPWWNGVVIVFTK